MLKHCYVKLLQMYIEIFRFENINYYSAYNYEKLSIYLLNNFGLNIIFILVQTLQVY